MRVTEILLLAVAAVSSASVIPSGPVVATKTLKGRDVAVTADDIERFRFFAEWAGTSYCNNDAADGAVIACSNNGCPLVTAHNATVVKSLNAKTASNIDGLIALDPVEELIVVAIRGSVSVRNWIADVLFVFTSCDFTKDCMWHFGFQESWQEIKAEVLATVQAAKEANPTYKIVVTGHSLGGAVATVAGASLRVAGYANDIYTFGSPRVGNQAFAQFVSEQDGAEYRLTHRQDPVPRLPPMFMGYRHTEVEYWLEGGESTTVDYGAGDVKVCQGTANSSCVNSVGINTVDHGYYLTYVAACHAVGLTLRDSTDAGSGSSSNVTDAELLQRLALWSEMDQAYAAQLAVDPNSVIS